MKITLLPSSVTPGEPGRFQYLTTFLVNDTLALDAGSLGFFGSPHDQARVRHILLSHSHMDHLASLPIFLENVYSDGSAPVTIYASAEVLHSLRSDLFNDRLWPDFISLSDQGKPLLALRELLPGKPFNLEGLTITPVPVNHAAPTLGFILDDGTAAVAIVGDTGPTDAIWKAANDTPTLKAVFLEVSFPEEMIRLAKIAGHLTPSLFAKEIRKLRRPTRVLAVHLKAPFRDRVVAELQQLKVPDLEIMLAGREYQF